MQDQKSPTRADLSTVAPHLAERMAEREPQIAINVRVGKDGVIITFERQIKQLNLSVKSARDLAKQIRFCANQITRRKQ